MASIQKRGKTYQYTVSRMVNGKSKPIRKGGFQTKKEARLAAAEIEIQLGKGRAPNVRSIPLVVYFDEWVKLYKSHLSHSTQLHYQYTSRELKDYFGDRPIQKISRHDYQRFLNKYGFTKSKESVEKVNSHVRACVKDAVEEGFLLHDFTRKAVITWANPSKKASDKHLNVVESEKLMKAVLSKLSESLCYSLILLGLTSGMRFGEMVGLTRKDFDFSQNKITINKTWGYMKRSPKGFGPTKNEQSNRRIKMDNATMLHFEQLFEFNPENPDDLVFYNRLSKYKVISNTQANDALNEILHNLGITPITIHGLRHTHASVLLYKNVSIYYVSERLGHSSIETTQKRYAHVVRELREKDEQKTMEIYNEIFHL